MDKTNDSKLNIERWINFHQIIEVIKHENRFKLPEPFKSFIDDVVDIVNNKFCSTIPSGKKLYRARLNKVNFNEKKQNVTPYLPSEMGTPPEILATSGRINPEGIPYLYCAGDIDTAGSELRPWKGAILTIAELEIQRDIKIVDLTLENEDKTWSAFFYDFTDFFSIQWPQELKMNYLVTQFFSEHFKSSGVRAIKYKSSFNEGGDNYALFNKEDYEIVETYCIEAYGIYYHFSKKTEV
jgi:hypothetical protein